MSTERPEVTVRRAAPTEAAPEADDPAVDHDSAKGEAEEVGPAVPSTSGGPPDAATAATASPAEAPAPAGGDTPAGDQSASAPAAGGTAATSPAAVDAPGAAGTVAAEGTPEVADGTTDKDDRWSAFAGRVEPTPGRIRRGLARTGSFLRHEWTLAALVSVGLAVALTWPTLRYPLHTIPQDIWDPTLQAWQMSWSGHILLTDPTRLWHSNAFYPELWSFAFSDGLLGYAPLGMIGEGPAAAILRYNIVFVLAHALATFGAYALVRQLGAGRTGAAVAGVSYAYAPWLLAQAGHLHIVSNGGIPLALAMLARGHGFSFRKGYDPDRRHAGWAAAGWLVAAWQLSLGFGIGLVFAYVLALVVVGSAVGWWIRRTWFWGVRRPFGRRLFVTDLAGGAVFAATGGLLAIPFFEVAADHPNAVRSVSDLEAYSPPVRGFFTAPPESLLWGGAHESLRASLPWAPEMTLLPGFFLLGLALAGLFFSIWSLRVRLTLLAAVLVTSVLAMGTTFFGGKATYLPLYDYLPGWDGLRTPGRLMLWTTLLLGVLAAGAVSAFVERVKEISAQRVPPWPSPWLQFVTLIPLLLVLAEGLNTTPHPIVPQQPAAMRTVEGPLLVLPSDQLRDENVMLWSTTRFQDIVNGGSGFAPERLDEVRQVTATFPDQASISYLRQMGVRNVVVLRDQVAGTPWETTIDLPVDSLGIRRQDVGNAVVFGL